MKPFSKTFSSSVRSFVLPLLRLAAPSSCRSFVASGGVLDGILLGLMACLLLLPISAHAQYYGSGGSYNAAVYGGGTATVPSGSNENSYPYSSQGNNTYGFNNYESYFSPAATASQCSGAISATFTWNNGGNANNLPPTSVITTETSSATVYAPSGGTGSCDDGLGQSAGGVASQNVTVSGSRYQVVSNPGASFTVPNPCSPSAMASGSSAYGGTYVTYGATASPVTINLTGTVLDSNQKNNILVGQGCTASLSGIPSALLNNTDHPPTYAWSVSGITFQTWSPTTPANPNANPPTPANPNASYYVGGYGPSTNPTAHWYWNDPGNASETVSCTVILTPPAGQGAAFSVTVTKPVIVQVPGWMATETGGYMQVNTGAPGQNSAFALYAGPNAGQSGGGMNWSANVMSSALFTSGTIELVQLVMPNMSYVTYTGVGVPGVTHSDPENGQFGLDTRYPYGWMTYGSYQPPYTPVPYTAYDDPSMSLSSGIASATMQHQFTDYLMFMPSGNDSQWVPLGKATWSTNGSAAVPTTDNWTDYVTQNGSDAGGTVNPNAGTPFTASNAFPSWTRINVFPSF